jgi:pyridoxal/pyridoxine/pyridoxamine kinase
MLEFDMNERIKELLVELKKTVSTHRGDAVLIGYDETEKFAELIVREMLEITDAHTEVFQTDRDRAVIEHIKQSVKTHFGVEE